MNKNIYYILTLLIMVFVFFISNCVRSIIYNNIEYNYEIEAEREYQQSGIDYVILPYSIDEATKKYELPINITCFVILLVSKICLLLKNKKDLLEDNVMFKIDFILFIILTLIFIFSTYMRITTHLM